MWRGSTHVIVIIKHDIRHWCGGDPHMFACNICRIYIIYSKKCNVGHKTSGGYLQLSAKYDVLYLKFVHKVFN